MIKQSPHESLKKGQKSVLTNCLAYLPYNFNPSSEDIHEFFQHNEHGTHITRPGAIELQRGWECHYSDEWAWFESGEEGNPPQSPPAAWIYAHIHAEESIAVVMLDFLIDVLTGQVEFMRIRPAWERACYINQVLNGHLKKKKGHPP